MVGILLGPCPGRLPRGRTPRPQSNYDQKVLRVNVAGMPIRRVRVDKSYDCPICGDIRTVEFENQEFDGDGPDASMLSAARADVLDYGECHAAANATNRRKPSRHDLATCPIFKSN